MEERRYQGELSLASMKKIGVLFLSRRQRNLIAGAAFVCMTFAISALIHKNMSVAAILVVGANLFVLEIVWLSGRSAKAAFVRMQQFFPPGEYIITLEDSAIRCRGQRAKHQLRCKYGEVVQISIKPGYLFLITHDRKVITFPVRGMEDDRWEYLQTFLSGHCSNAVGGKRL